MKNGWFRGRAAMRRLLMSSMSRSNPRAEHSDSMYWRLRHAIQMKIRTSPKCSLKARYTGGSTKVWPMSICISVAISSTRKHSRRSRIRLYSAAAVAKDLNTDGLYIN